MIVAGVVVSPRFQTDLTTFVVLDLQLQNGPSQNASLQRTHAAVLSFGVLLVPYARPLSTAHT